MKYKHIYGYVKTFNIFIFLILPCYPYSKEISDTINNQGKKLFLLIQSTKFTDQIVFTLATTVCSDLLAK